MKRRQVKSRNERIRERYQELNNQDKSKRYMYDTLADEFFLEPGTIAHIVLRIGQYKTVNPKNDE